MVHIQAGINHGDLHAGAGVAQLLGPDSGNPHHLATGGRQGTDVRCASLNRLIHRGQEHALDAIQGGNLLQILELRINGKGVGQVRKLVANRQLLALQNAVLNGGNHRILLLEHPLLRSRRDLMNRRVGVCQGGVLHHNKRCDTLARIKLLCRLTQLLYALRGNSLVQRWGRILLQSSGNPGAAFYFRGHRLQGIGLQCLGNHGLGFLRHGSGGFCAWRHLCGCHTVRTYGRCVDRWRQDAENHTEYQEHGQQMFVFHMYPPREFVCKTLNFPQRFATTAVQKFKPYRFQAPEFPK